MATFIKNMGVGSCCDCTGRVNPCDTCSCPSPTLKVDSISASHTKCGFGEFGTASYPLKIYTTKSQSGGLVNVDYLGNGYLYTNSWSGSVSINRLTCGVSSDTRKLYASVSGNCSNSGNYTGNQGQADYDPGSGNYNGLFVWGQDCSIASVSQLFGCSGPTVNSTTQTTYAQASCDPAGGSDVIVSLSTEYTTALLKLDTASLLPAWPGTFSSVFTSSYANLTSDELTYTMRRIRYKFLIPSLPSGSCYKINWLEGAVAKSYTWNGTDTETPVYTLNEPSYNGSISINTVTVNCSCL